MPEDTDLSRYEQFLTTSVEDHEGRAKISLTEEDYDHLHGLAIEGIVPWKLYYHVNTARKADGIYLKGGKEKGWTIAQLRQKLNSIETRNYTKNGEDITEIISHRGWPFFQHIQRTRKKESSTIHELELAYPANSNVDTLFEKYSPGFEEESLLLAQKHPDSEFVKEVAFLPPENVTYRVIFSVGDPRKEFEFPVALRYKALLQKFKRLYPLSRIKFYPKEPRPQTLQRHSSDELQEGLIVLWKAVREYDPTKVKHIPGYLKEHAEWHMKDQRKAKSTQAGAKFREFKKKSILQERLEQSGGPLDELLALENKPHTKQSTIVETLQDTAVPQIEGEINLKQVTSHIPDPTDRKIVWGLTAWDLPQKELARDLGMSPAAISKRIKKLQPKIREILHS